MASHLFVGIVGGFTDSIQGEMQGMKALGEAIAARWPGSVQFFPWNATDVAERARASQAEVIALAGFSMGAANALEAATQLRSVAYLAVIDSVPRGLGQVVGQQLVVPATVKVCRAWRRQRVLRIDFQPISQFPTLADATATDFHAIPVGGQSHWQLPHDPGIHAAILAGIAAVMIPPCIAPPLIA